MRPAIGPKLAEHKSRKLSCGFQALFFDWVRCLFDFLTSIARVLLVVDAYPPAGNQPAASRARCGATTVRVDAKEVPAQSCGQGSDPGMRWRDDLADLRPSPGLAVEIRARGEDPYIGQRLNYLGGTLVPFSPLLQALTAEQRVRFDEFRAIFQRDLATCNELDRTKFYQEPDGFTLLLFLQADNYKPHAASARLLRTMVWRQQSGFEDFIDNPDETAWQLYMHLRPRKFFGHDRDGNPLYVEPLGAFFGSDNGVRGMPTKKWVLCYAYDISLQQVAFRQASLRNGRAIHRVTYIGDMRGLRMRQGKDMIGFLRLLTKEVESHFPECAGTVALIHMPAWAPVLLKMAKVFLDRKTASRVSVHSGVPQVFLEKIIDKDTLPTEWGGTSCQVLPYLLPLAEVLQRLRLQEPLSE